MRLNRLQILGFKSFADEVELEFQPGLTAVVGPNGCGKSNISDAIRWVLGEQNVRFLRGKEMEDVIFNGTASRKPSGMAEIILELNNLGSLPLDCPHVQITRRLFRSGDSEYLLNNKTCRLKDITDLFLEWGVSKRVYSTVEQGNIDFIINAKPQERRILIETAAGILKYKERKREAAQKMELTKGNLERIQDIRAEVENQRQSLHRQAKRARLYRTLCQQAGEKEERYLILRSRILRHHCERTSAGYQALADQEQEMLVRLRGREAELEAARLESTRLGSDFERLHKDLWERESEKRQMEKRMESLVQERQLREEALERCKRERDALGSRNEQGKKAVRDLEEQAARLNEELAAREEGRKGIEEERNTLMRQAKESQEGLEERRRSLAAARTRMSLVQNNLSHLRVRETELNKGIAEKSKAAGDASGHEERLKGEIGEARKKREVLAAQIKAAEDVCRGLNTEQEGISASLRDLSSRIEKQQEVCARLRHRKAHLEELEQRFEGYRSAVRHLLENGAARTIAHLISTEERYEHALESVLGDELQGIPYESRENALAMIRELRSGEKGKATFIPVSIERSSDIREVPPPLRSHPGFVGRLIDLVRFPEKYHHLFVRLLEDILIVKDFESGLDMERQNPAQWRFVSLSGDIIRPDGSLFGGGSEHPSGGLLSRAREIQEIGAQLAQESTSLDGLLTEQGRLSEARKECDRRIADLRAEIQRYDHRLRDADRDLRYQNGEVEGIDRRKKRLLSDIRQLEKDRAGLLQSITREEERERDIDKEITRIQGEIPAWEQSWGRVQKDQQALHQTYMDEGIALASLKERIRSFDRERKNAGLAHSERERDLDRVEREIQGIKARIEEINTECARLDTQIPRCRDMVIKQQEDLERVRGLFNQAKERVIDLEEGLKSIRRDLDEIRKHLKAREVEAAEWRTRLEELHKSFPACPEQGAASQEEIESHESEVKDLMARLDRLKERMQRFGSVNLAAIEEFQGVDERFQFLTRQTADLQNALDSLRSIIKEINATSRELFQDAFHQINGHFHAIFSRLFEGGQAELRLEEGMDCLEAGIHIVAQPPGKRLQRIDLLSGGEKALTALALMLAVYQLKPSPFCILDEVDAPLDETNVDRFVRLIQDMKEKTQFIIITHCKRTMMSVDSIYGITMETPGVSKIVSVRIDQAQDFYAASIPQKKEGFAEAVQ
ncbi:MAG: chromosome segregation protein SMC [bacterium]